MINAMLLIFLMLPYVRFAEYALPDSLNIFLEILRIISVSLTFIMYIKQKKYSPIIILIFIYQLILLLATIFNFGTIFEQINSLLTIVSICMIFDMGIKKNPKEFFKYVCIVFCSSSLFCIISMLKFYPVGMYIDARLDNNYYLLGQDNASFFDILPSIAYLGVYEILCKEKFTLKIFLYSLFVLYGFIYVNSTTAFICLMLILLFEVTSKLKIWNKIISYKNILIFTILSLALLMFIGVSNISFLVYFVQEKLGKSLTLTGRTLIWKKALYYISKSPLLGYGFESTDILVQKFNINHVHNIVLQILYNGGLVGAYFFCLINYKVGKKLKDYKGTIIFKLILFTIFIFFIASQFDYYNRRFLIFTLFVIGYNIEYLIGVKKSEDKKIS